MAEHFHTKTDELCVYHIPADTDQEMELRPIPSDWRSMGTLVGGYIEIVRSLPLHLECDCQIVMVVNEEGRLQRLGDNIRASVLYPEGIVGDAFLVGEGPVFFWESDDDEIETDLFSLPQALSRWEGPGHPLPPQKQPWEVG